MSNGNTLIYCVDTSSLISGINKTYPLDIFVSLWENIDELIREGKLRVSEEVVREISKKDDGAAEWVMDRMPDIAIPTDNDVAEEVRSILRVFPALVKEMKNRDRADAFVIGVAQLHGATVVTEENLRHGSADRPKIPYVCDELGITCITVSEISRLEGWIF